MRNKLVAALLVTAALPVSVHAQDAAAPFTTGMRYDAAHRVTGTITAAAGSDAPAGFIAVRDSYDPAGRLIRVEKGSLASWHSEAMAPVNWPDFAIHQQVDTTYDELGRKTAERTSSAGTIYTLTQYSYNDQGLLECSAIRMDAATFGSSATSACSLTSATNPTPDRISRQLYDDAGQLLKVQQAYGTPLQQDNVGYSYSSTGKQLSVTDAKGNRAEMTYDGMDRKQRWVFPSPTNTGQANPGDYEEYGYDANGNRTSIRKRDGRTLGYAYDALNHVTVKSVPTSCIAGYSCTNAPAWATRSVYYAYDLPGHETEARYDGASGADGVFSTYDGFGRLHSTTTAMNGTIRQMKFDYDADGNRVGLTFPDGGLFSYGFDGLDREQSIARAGATAIAMSYDAVGEPGDINRANGAVTHRSYDGVNRLHTLTHDLTSTGYDQDYQFQYNPAGQIVGEATSNDTYGWSGATNVTTDYVVNGLNQNTSVANVAFSYDANGNLTSDGNAGYIYDAENRLVRASNGATLTYDPEGRLWQIAGGPSGNIQFLYDGDRLSAEYDGSGNLLRRYVHGTGDDDPLIWYEGGGFQTPTYYHADHEGSIVALSDANGNGSVNSYDEFGVPARRNAGRLQYTGQAWLTDLGFYYYKARLYSPKLGRFLQTDPVGYKDQVNLYAYVANDPVNHTDPSGNQIAGTFNEETACHGDASCVQGYREGQAKAGGIALEIASWIAPLFIPVAGEEIDATRALTKAEQLIQNRAAGKAGEAATRAKLGDTIAGEQVAFRTSTGKRARPDFVTKDRGIVESKAGDGALSPGQRQLKQDVDAGRPVTPVGQNARNAGLKPGEPTIMKSCKIDRTC